ncbi:MAG: PQQ-binding-like beta-propeller repeat protein [Planctomycetota bacterium]
MVAPFFALTAVALLPLVQGSNWPQFRGPEGGANARGADVYPSRVDVDRPTWRTPLPPGHSSPCVHCDHIYVTAHRDRKLLTICLDRTTGRELWRRSISVESVERHHDINGPASSTPAADGECVVSYFGSFGLVAHDHEGEELWRRPLTPQRNTFGSAASPILRDGRLLFVRDAQEGSTLESIDAKTGEVAWKVDRARFGSGWSTPTIVERDGVSELLVYGVWWLVAYDLATGAERWRAPGLTDEPITSPVPAGDLVLVTSYNMKTNPEVEGLPTFAALLEELDADGSGTLDAAEIERNESVLSRHDADGEGDHPLGIFMRWMDGDRDGEVTAGEWNKVVEWVDGFAHANGVLALRPPPAAPPAVPPAASDGPTPQAEIAWTFPRGVPECPSPVVASGRVHLVKNGGLATTLDAATGELLWQERLGARGPYYASPVVADGKVYACSARGELTVFAAAARFERLGRADFGERIMATPALAGGTLYVRTAEALYAFGPSAR